MEAPTLPTLEFTSRLLRAHCDPMPDHLSLSIAMAQRIRALAQTDSLPHAEIARKIGYLATAIVRTLERGA